MYKVLDLARDNATFTAAKSAVESIYKDRISDLKMKLENKIFPDFSKKFAFIIQQMRTTTLKAAS